MLGIKLIWFNLNNLIGKKKNKNALRKEQMAQIGCCSKGGKDANSVRETQCGSPNASNSTGTSDLRKRLV